MNCLSLNVIVLFPKELVVRWATDAYVFDESQITATVELVTDSTFEVNQVSIQGFPRQIPDGNPNRIDNLVVPGPTFPGAGEIKLVHFSHTSLIDPFVSDVHAFML